MTVKQIPLTKGGLDQLKYELDRLIQKERPRLSQAISRARDLGDLKENAEYHSAKDQQGIVEARIRFLQHQIQHAHVIDVASLPQTGKVTFGTTLTLINCETDMTFRYQLVGEDEANIKQNKISIQSPIARACIGKRADDVVEVETPEGIIEYEIASVEYI